MEFNDFCTREMFVPHLTIYPSEWKRRVYLNNFLDCMFNDDVLEKYNEKTEYSGIHIVSLFEEVYFKIFNYTYTIDKDVCKVVASFISYLGTNGGSQFLLDVERFKEIKNVPSEYAYELTWAYENLRRYGHNHNYRAIEYILNPVENHPSVNSIYFSINAYSPTVKDYETIEYVKKACNPDLEVAGILINKYNRLSKLHRESVGTAKMVAENFKIPIFKTYIRNSAALSEAQSLQCSIFEYAPKTAGVRDYLKLSNEILNCN